MGEQLPSQSTPQGKPIRTKEQSSGRGGRKPYKPLRSIRCQLCESEKHRTPTCKTYLGSTERRKRLVSLKKCPDCTQTHEGNCIVTYKCRICLDGSHLDYLCPGPKTPNAQKRLTDGLGKSSNLRYGIKGQDLTYLEKEALDSEEVKVMSYSIGKKEHKTDPDIGIDQKLHAELQQTETKINEQKLQIADLNSKLENYALAYDNINSQL